VLTDGSVSNTNQVITAIENNCVFNSARVFAIGIGNGCSETLVRGVAKAGNGKAIFIKDTEDVEGKIIRLLEDSLTPSITNF
jgi:von Willebrand factor A domain-containing protein 5